MSIQAEELQLAKKPDKRAGSRQKHQPHFYSGSSRRLRPASAGGMNSLGRFRQFKKLSQIVRPRWEDNLTGRLISF
jgi:hypothetical protein